ncbi:MAG: endo alpha-1,4 polygalactosaminidase [Candidatus Nanopelagicales bacterium]|nr:endo alpha-1,4 polygalactosaminidase [Candidatus Nanopelagicales bacterium]
MTREAIPRATIRSLLGAVLLGLSVVAGTPIANATHPEPVLEPGGTPTRLEEAGRGRDTFHIQFSGKLRVPTGTDVVEIDGEDTRARRVTKLHARGIEVVCYVSAGTFENYRRDAAKFPARVIGEQLPDWPDERWLDIRKRGVLRPIMTRRARACARKGFDGIEFDNVDGYANNTGFPLRRADQIKYDKMLARIARKNALSPGLKNAVGLVKDLEPAFDWALNEECVTYRECGRYRPFVRSGKAVIVIEYGGVSQKRLCRVTGRLGLSGQMKRLSLSAWSRPC